jgi:hypothetical protein
MSKDRKRSKFERDQDGSGEHMKKFTKKTDRERKRLKKRDKK